ncbi:phospholipid phosphatase 2-like [Panonychus citri]|uniref:phospholipid phosphatase 2-like n=1 Tax=Panonychus citri TaxID=50023 RepID=UPI002307C0AE|nr:phospholipid phosphatase 2-like [Panonychus citri]
MKLKCTLINVTTLIILFVGIILVSIAKPNRRGFWCSDESIKYPRQPDTVGGGQLAVIVLVIPLIVIISGELIAHKLNLNTRKSWRRQLNVNGSNHIEQAAKVSTDHSVSSWSVNINSIIISWLFSLFLTALLTGFIKTQVGRLRPVFYSQCKSSVSCDDQQNHGVYLTDYVCNIKPSEEIFIRTSFPSGHSSYSMSSMVFLIVYIGQRFLINRTNSLRYLIASVQMSFLIIALYVGLSRVSDNIHHWSDVLVGLILGAGVTLICTLFLGFSGDQWSIGECDNKSIPKDENQEQLETF